MNEDQYRAHVVAIMDIFKQHRAQDARQSLDVTLEPAIKRTKRVRDTPQQIVESKTVEKNLPQNSKANRNVTPKAPVEKLPKKKKEEVVSFWFILNSIFLSFFNDFYSL